MTLPAQAVVALILLSSARAQSPAERSMMAQSFASEKVWAWQKRLNLGDWDISVKVSRAADLKPHTLGNVQWNTRKKTAVIHVLDPADYDLSPAEALRDIEFTVVHELIHLEVLPILADLKRADANRAETESAINHMVGALLDLDRRQ